MVGLLVTHTGVTRVHVMFDRFFDMYAQCWRIGVGQRRFHNHKSVKSALSTSKAAAEEGEHRGDVANADVASTILIEGVKRTGRLRYASFPL